MEPAGRIAPRAWMGAPALRRVIAALTASGMPARFVGGCVRDAVLDRPVTDIDIATPEPPERVVALLAAAGIKAVPTGIEHGTVTAVAGGAHFEVTSLRRDVETYGRRARVAFTDDWVSDAKRRDFTINALFCDLDGTLYDPVSGLGDLHAGRVRFVGDPAQRIAEDRLRLLRFFRFQAYYGRTAPDTAALAACRAAAPELRLLSAERVWSELRRLLLAPDPEAAFRLMAGADVLAHVLPEATRLDRLGRLAGCEPARGVAPDPTRRLAAATETSTEAAAALAERLRLSRAETRRLQRLAEHRHLVDRDTDVRALRRALYAAGAATVRDLVLIAEADGGPAPACGWDALYATIAAWRPVRLPVQGRDALALGVGPGPALGAALRRLEAWWIAEDFAPGREACLARLAEILAESHGG